LAESRRPKQTAFQKSGEEVEPRCEKAILGNNSVNPIDSGINFVGRRRSIAAPTTTSFYEDTNFIQKKSKQSFDNSIEAKVGAIFQIYEFRS